MDRRALGKHVMVRAVSDARDAMWERPSFVSFLRPSGWHTVMGIYSPKRAQIARLTTPSPQYDPSAKYRPRTIWRWLQPRRMRRKLTLLLPIMVTVILIIRWMQQPEYDWRFLEDESEDILGPPTEYSHQPDYTKRSESSQQDSGSRKQARVSNEMPGPLERGRDGLTRVGDWEGQHPLFEIIQRADDDFRKEVASRPVTVRR